MTAAATIEFPETVEACLKAFLKDLEEFAGYGRQRPADAFREWSRMAAVPIMAATAHLAGDMEAHHRYEQEYARIEESRKDYCKNPQTVGSRMFSYVMQALELKRSDFLGICMERELNATNSNHGQVFTPPHIAHFMGRMALGGALNGKPTLDEHGLITVCEPACGTGVITIEYLEVLREEGFAQKDVWVEAEDIDELAYNCCYIQLSLLGAAGSMRLGNTLAFQYREQVYTPGAFIHGTIWRVLDARRKDKEKGVGKPAEAREAEKATVARPAEQDAPAASVEPAEAVPVMTSAAPPKLGQLELF